MPVVSENPWRTSLCTALESGMRKTGRNWMKKEVKSGFRRIEQKGELQFFINGRPVRMWGANLVHAEYHDRLLSQSPGKTV